MALIDDIENKSGIDIDDSLLTLTKKVGEHLTRKSLTNALASLIGPDLGNQLVENWVNSGKYDTTKKLIDHALYVVQDFVGASNKNKVYAYFKEQIYLYAEYG